MTPEEDESMTLHIPFELPDLIGVLVDRDITLSDMNSVRVSRTHLVKWVHHPSFDQVVTGCFVRWALSSSSFLSLFLGILVFMHRLYFCRVGLGGSGKDQVYRIAEIVKVVEKPTYTIDKVKTNVTFPDLLLSDGTNLTFTTLFFFFPFRKHLNCAREHPPG